MLKMALRQLVLKSLLFLYRSRLYDIIGAIQMLKILKLMFVTTYEAFVLFSHPIFLF